MQKQSKLILENLSAKPIAIKEAIQEIDPRTLHVYYEDPEGPVMDEPLYVLQDTATGTYYSIFKHGDNDWSLAVFDEDSETSGWSTRGEIWDEILRQLTELERTDALDEEITNRFVGFIHASDPTPFDFGNDARDRMVTEDIDNSDLTIGSWYVVMMNGTIYAPDPFYEFDFESSAKIYLREAEQKFPELRGELRVAQFISTNNRNQLVITGGSQSAPLVEHSVEYDNETYLVNKYTANLWKFVIMDSTEDKEKALSSRGASVGQKEDIIEEIQEVQVLGLPSKLAQELINFINNY